MTRNEREAALSLECQHAEDLARASSVRASCSALEFPLRPMSATAELAETIASCLCREGIEDMHSLGVALRLLRAVRAFETEGLPQAKRMLHDATNAQVSREPEE